MRKRKPLPPPTLEELVAAEDEDWAADCRRQEYRQSDECAAREKLAAQYAKRGNKKGKTRQGGR